MEAEDSYSEVARIPLTEPMIHDIEFLVHSNLEELALAKPP